MTSYIANCATVADEAEVSRTSCLDGLGRLYQVTENGIVENGIPDVWELSHVGSRGLNVGPCKTYHARKRFRKFNCVMFAITPCMNDRPYGAFGQLSCVVLKRMRESHNA